MKAEIEDGKLVIYPQTDEDLEKIQDWAYANLVGDKEVNALVDTSRVKR